MPEIRPRDPTLVPALVTAAATFIVIAIMAWCLSVANAAHAQTPVWDVELGPILMVTPQDFGAAPDDDIDDAAAFQDALAALAAWHEQVPTGRPTLAIGPGLWKIENISNRKHGLLITNPVTLACAPGAILEGDLTPGDHLDPPEDWTSKRLWTIQAGLETDLHGVHIDNCTFHFNRAHDANEQAHAIAVLALGNGWVRDVTLTDVTCNEIGSGDCAYFGRLTERITLRRIHATDVARNVVSFAGVAGASHRRTGFTVDGIYASWTFDEQGRTDGNAIDFEPPAAGKADRFYDVDIRNVFAPTGSVDIFHIEGGIFETMHLSKVSSAVLNGTVFRDVVLDCREGAWGDGVGACWSHTGWPAVFRVEDLVARVHPDGAGVLAVRDPKAGLSDADNIARIDMHGRVQFNGTVSDRDVADTPGFYSDRLRVLTGFTVVPDPPVVP